MKIFLILGYKLKVSFEMQQKFNKKVNEQQTVVRKTRIIFLFKKI